MLTGLLMPIVGGILSGFGINLVGLVSSGGSRVALKVVPMAIRLALKLARRGDDELAEDARQLIGAADPKIVDKVQKEDRRND